MKALQTLSLCLLLRLSAGLGRHNFECPDGYAITEMSSSFAEDRRHYSFGCSPLRVEKETCRHSHSASSAKGDLHVACEGDEYTAGVSRMEGAGETESWSLLCCRSPRLKLAKDGCKATQLLNSFHGALAYETPPGYVVRKWQAIHEEASDDRRWWLLVCPLWENGSGGADGEEVKLRFTRSLLPSRFDLASPGHHSLRPAYHLTPELYKRLSAPKVKPKPSVPLPLPQVQNGPVVGPPLPPPPPSPPPPPPPPPTPKVMEIGTRVTAHLRPSSQRLPLEYLRQRQRVHRHRPPFTPKPRIPPRPQIRSRQEYPRGKSLGSIEDYLDYYNSEPTEETRSDRGRGNIGATLPSDDAKVNGILHGMKKVIENLSDGLELAEMVIPDEAEFAPIAAASNHDPPLSPAHKSASPVQGAMEYLGLCQQFRRP